MCLNDFVKLRDYCNLEHCMHLVESIYCIIMSNATSLLLKTPNECIITKRYCYDEYS